MEDLVVYLLIFILIIVVALVLWKMLPLVTSLKDRMVGKAESTLEQEYHRWLTISTLMREFERLGRTQKASYEALNILERWILSIANEKKDGDAILNPNVAKLSATEKCTKELIEKKLLRPADAKKFMARMIGLIMDYFAHPSKEEEGTVEIKGNVVKYKNFSCEISAKRLELLRERASDVEIATMVLRYACLVTRGQQWNIPSSVFAGLVEKFNVDLEGFASPLNSQLMKHKRSFCSLFTDTDSVFGSIGPFFDQDLVGHRSIINPPYVEPLMDRMAEKCLADCTRAEKEGKDTLMIFTVPVWKDAKYFTSLTKSKYCCYSKEHAPGTYSYEDSNNGDKKVETRFATQSIVLHVPAKSEKVDCSMVGELFAATK